MTNFEVEWAFRVISELPDDWDGWGAPPPSKEAIACASSFVLDLQNKFGIEPDLIDPDAMGGVAIYFTANQNQYWVCVSNYLRIAVVSLTEANAKAMSIETAEDLAVLLNKDLM
jgi:hypothetical protein